jgi:hypothetical protein
LDSIPSNEEEMKKKEEGKGGKRRRRNNIPKFIFLFTQILEYLTVVHTTK